MGRYLFCWLIALLLLPLPAAAVGTSASAAILMDADSGRVLYEQNADQKMLIASTTKIMTALIALREGQLHDEAVVSCEAAETEGSSMYLRPGEKLTLEELLYGLLLNSGNDAAVAIAEHVSGSVPAFVTRMNEMAADLGMTHSSFANPNGLDHELHYSTARDMAFLAQAAMQNETFVRIASTRSVTIGDRTLVNHNKLLRYMDGCLGLKTGYTRAAGRTLVSCAEQKGQRLIVVTLRDGNDWADHQALYRYGFETYPAHSEVAVGEFAESVPIQGGTAATVPLAAAETFAWPLAEGEHLERKLQLSCPVKAPVMAGGHAGELKFFLNGTEVGQAELLFGKTVLPKASTALGVLKIRLPE